MISVTKRRYYPWVCWSLAAMAYFLQYGLMVFPSTIPLEIQGSLNITPAELGVFSAAFLYAFVAMQIPAGLMFDRFGARNLLFYSTLLMAIGCVVLGLSHNYWMALLGRLLMGVGGSFSFVGAVYLARTWFPIFLFPIVVGATESISGLGEIGLPALFAGLKNIQSWRVISLEISLVVLVLAFLIRMNVRDKKRLSVKHHVNLKADLLRTLKNKNLWLLGLFTGFAYAHFMVMTDMWGVLFLRHRYDLSVGDAIFENSLVILGYTIGCASIAYALEFISSRRLMLLCVIGILICHVFLTFYMVNLYIESALLFIVGFATSVVVLAYDVAERIVPSTSY
ncbi:MAG: MFS transporter, partial [Coxiellaceae bacterium]|nr:MFS transporter [Coxiellaceae bacterium]